MSGVFSAHFRGVGLLQTWGEIAVVWPGGASQFGCQHSIGTGTVYPLAIAGGGGIISPTARDPRSVSILTASEMPGEAANVFVVGTMVAQVWSTGAGAVIFAPLSAFGADMIHMIGVATAVTCLRLAIV
jgi:hypothetical protein